VSIRRAGGRAGALPLRGVDRVIRDLVPDRRLPRAQLQMQTTGTRRASSRTPWPAFIIALPALLPRDVGALAPVVAVGNGKPLVIEIDALTFRMPRLFACRSFTYVSKRAAM